MTFSRDPQQTYIYAANGVDEKINILLRSSLEVLTSFGDGGRQPGQFFGVHNLATDSKGNLYATETYTGARVQRFIFKGVGPVTQGSGRALAADRALRWARQRACTAGDGCKRSDGTNLSYRVRATRIATIAARIATAA